MSLRAVSTRTAFVLVSIVTILLIVGSAFLSRVVFKAASSSATLYFSQSSIQAKPETTFKIEILADLSASADLTGVQLELNFDPKIVNPTDFKPAVRWKKVFSKVENGKLFLVMVPVEDQVQSNQAATGLSLVSLTFTTLAEGATNLTLTAANTLLAVASTPGAKGVENVVESVIDAQVSVSNMAIATPTDDSLKVNAITTQDEVVFSSQRILSTSSILTPSSAVILVHLEHPARVSVAFGATTALGNRADYSTRADQAAIRIAGLAASQRYYYQVVAEDDDATNRVLGQIKSFELPALSSATTVDRAELTIFPARAATGATAYAVFFDQDNKVVSGLNPEIKVDTDRVSATKFSEVSGLYQSVLGSLETEKLTIFSAVLLDGQELAGANVMFDPALANTAVKPNQTFLAIKFDQKTINVILALVAGLLMLGVGFYKLARAR
ncbi:MAG: cohesin domain-containing protein [Patescibacteria group bacterium]